MPELHEFGHELTPLDEVRDRILAELGPLPYEVRRLNEAAGGVLREDLVARECVPSFDNSAMDGYGVVASDLAGASEATPVTLPVLAPIAAGQLSATPLRPGVAVRIMTGAPLPPRCEAVVPHELTRFDEESVTFTAPIAAGKNVRRAGGDMKPGDRLLEAGAVLHAGSLAIAATLGRPELHVTRRLRVAVLATGSELVEVGATPGPGQIRNSNSATLGGLVAGIGCEVDELGIVRDDREAVARAIRDAYADGADVVISSGGASAGDHDWVHRVVSEEANPGEVFKVAMRPGKPLVFGLFSGRPFFGLPGNPASAIVSFEAFVRPALRRLRGESEVLPRSFLVRFPFEHRYRSGRTFLLRTRVEPDLDAGGFRVLPPGEQDSSFLASMASANALVILPPDEDRVPAGATRPAWWLSTHRP